MSVKSLELEDDMKTIVFIQQQGIFPDVLAMNTQEIHGINNKCTVGITPCLTMMKLFSIFRR